MNNSMLIMCRGNSLSRVQEINQKYEQYGIINEWKDQLEQETFKELLIGKNMMHYVNRDARVILPKYQYDEYNIKYCQLNVLEPEYNRSPIRQVLNNSGIETEFMCEDLVKYSSNGRGGFPSTGVMALVHSVVCLKKKNVCVIGMDFFEDDYYTHHTNLGVKEVQEYQKKKNINMKPFVTNFLKQNKEVNFVFYTNSSFDPKLDHEEIR